MPEDSEPFEKPVSAAVRLIVLKHWVAGYRRLVFMAILGQVFFIFKKPPLNYDDNTALSRAIDYTEMLAKGGLTRKFWFSYGIILRQLCI